MMIDLRTTVLCSTSSYALLLAEEVTKRNLKDKIHLKTGIMGSERWGEKMRSRIEAELEIETFKKLIDVRLSVRYNCFGR